MADNKRQLGGNYLNNPDLEKLAVLYRRVRKICRKCFCRLPLNAKICNKCKNPDIRYKKYFGGYSNLAYDFDKNTKNKMINKWKK